MSVAISWRGSVRAERKEALEDAISVFCADMEWGLEELEVDTGPVAEGGRGKVPGRVLLPHFAVDPVPVVVLPGGGELVEAYVEDLGAGRRALGREPMISTLFGGPAVHREVVAFLEMLGAHCEDFSVDDETGWWGTRDQAALAARFAAAWEGLARQVRATLGPSSSRVEIAGWAVEPGVPPGAEEATEETAELIGALARGFEVVHGGLGRGFSGDADGVENLDLVLDEVLEEEEWSELRRSEEGERIVHGAGAVFGRQMLAALGGRWEGTGGGLMLADIGGCGLRLDPFEHVLMRLEHGPSYGLPLVLELAGRISAALAAG